LTCKKRQPRFVICLVCGTDDHPYMAKGMCSYCYLKQYNASPANREKAKQHKRAWHLKNMPPEKQKQIREAKWFDSHRESVLRRDGHRCVQCGSLDNLVVHHVDQQGRGKTQVNNALENLQTLCRACHMAAHRSREWIEKRRPVKPSGRWSRRHDVCRDCGTTTRHHGAHGFCRTCYARLQRGPLPIEDMVRAFEKSKEADRNRVSRNKKATK
jgi:5-methylcytosine-specific restriction endonuclease McrA